MKNQVAFKKFPMDFLYTTTLEALAPLVDKIHECLSTSFTDNSIQWKIYFLDLLTLDFSNKVFQILKDSRVLGLTYSEFDLQTEAGNFPYSSRFFCFTIFLLFSEKVIYQMGSQYSFLYPVLKY